MGGDDNYVYVQLLALYPETLALRKHRRYGEGGDEQAGGVLEGVDRGRKTERREGSQGGRHRGRGNVK